MHWFIHSQAALVARLVKRLPAMQETNPWVGKIPWRKKWQPTPMFWPGESHGQRGLLGYSPWCCKESANTFICPPGNPLAIEPLIDITSFLKAVPVSWHKGHWICGLECQAFSPFSFTTKRLNSSSLLSAIRVVSSAYLRLLIFFPAILILACDSSSQEWGTLHRS